MKTILLLTYLLNALIVQTGLAVLISQPALAKLPVQSKVCTQGQHWGRCENPQSGRRYLGCCQHPR